MVETLLEELHNIPSFSSAIISAVMLYRIKNEVDVTVVTDKPYTEEEASAVKKAVRHYIPQFFAGDVRISKLTPDEGMVAKKILELVGNENRQLASLISAKDVEVKKVDNGFSFTISVIRSTSYSSDAAKHIAEKLRKCFCGEFYGKCVEKEYGVEDIKVEEKHENIEYVIPPRMFRIEEFEPIESVGTIDKAVYAADLNFLSENVALCGELLDVREKAITNGKGREKAMFNFLISDTTASIRVGYFSRQKSIDKIRALKKGDFVVLTCKTEMYNGMVRPTAVNVDKGRPPKDFVPESRSSKPVPEYYETVFPEPYIDFTQGDFFTDTSLPDCLRNNTFVVFDLETTGLNRSPAGGAMDRIIEIGAYKIIGGEIKEAFSTFVNPERRLSQEIIGLTGIDESMVKDAPTFRQVMPDFYKFIDGCYLVGHNVADFDFKFIDYYCSVCGYIPQRKIFDTIPLSQQLLHLSNYKLNTVADHFNISFNHHRATDDALATAKIFIELIKIKKSLPTLC